MRSEEVMVMQGSHNISRSTSNWKICFLGTLFSDWIFWTYISQIVNIGQPSSKFYHQWLYTSRKICPRAGYTVHACSNGNCVFHLHFFGLYLGYRSKISLCKRNIIILESDQGMYESLQWSHYRYIDMTEHPNLFLVYW